MKMRWWIVAYIIVLGVVLLSPLASSSPDGLERVGEDHEFIELAEDAPYSVVPDYLVPGVENEGLATILAGVIGVTIMFIVLAGGTHLVLRATAGANRRA